jgi:isoleucyl-tRNA synthetase
MQNRVELPKVLGIDQYILASLHSLYQQVQHAYETYNYASAYSSLVLFCRQRYQYRAFISRGSHRR